MLVTYRDDLGSVLSLFFLNLFPLGMESRFSLQSADVMTATTNKSQALQLGIKRFTNSSTKQDRGSAAELSHFNICLIDCFLTGIPQSGKLERGHSPLSTRVDRICMNRVARQ